MRKKNMKKKIICLLLSIMIGIEPCFAAGIKFTNIKQGGNNNTDEEKDPYTDTGWKNYGDTNYQYSYKYDINSSTTISVNAYNLDGTSVIPEKTTIEKDKFTFKAGTWVGINVSEYKSVAWEIKDLKYRELTTTTKYHCYYKEEAHPVIVRKTTTMSETMCNAKGDKKILYEHQYNVAGPANSMISFGKCTYNIESQDPGGDEIDFPSAKSCEKKHNTYYKLTKQTSEPIETQKEVSADVKKEMKELAIKEITAKAEASVKNTSGSVQYITNNVYPTKTEDITYGYINEAKEVKEPNQKDPEPQEKDGVITGSLMRQYEFLQSKVCMNLKTSNVSYGRDCKAEDGEVSIANGTAYDDYLKEDVNYWHYFIPLNITSDTEFTLDIIKNENQKFDVNTCKNFIAKNPKTYQDLIIPAGDNGTFEGDYDRYDDKSLSTDLETLATADGCNISTKIKFPISQEFYNEVEQTTASNEVEYKLKGFNFYYKPININNPFPNGFATTSIWQNVDEKTLDLSKSFEEKTYVTTKINAKTIRDYNKDNPYTDWTNMYTTGVSSFIENEKIVTRLVKNDSFYKLGCGPANTKKYLDEDKNIKNVKYIERCDAS